MELGVTLRELNHTCVVVLLKEQYLKQVWLTVRISSTLGGEYMSIYHTFSVIF